ncbi:hypothetical protein D918_05174 [Trichuris suis]|nr:hypothetical protein D918_05174 [Trichuris suis]
MKMSSLFLIFKFCLANTDARVVLYLPLVFLLGALSAVILIYKCSELWYPSEIVYVPKDEYSGSMTNRARVQAYTVVDSLYIDDQDSYTLLEVMFRKMLSFLPHKTNRRHGIQNALLLLLWDNFKETRLVRFQLTTALPIAANSLIG